MTATLALMAGPGVRSRRQARTIANTFAGPPGMDENAFRALYTRTARPLRGYIARVIGNQALADDVLQETYFRLLRSGFRCDDETNLRSYLFRIATNLMRDHFRRPVRETGEVPEVADAAHFPEAVQLRSDVGGALAELHPRDRSMLWLAYVEGSSHEEVAAALGLRAASVRSMLSRARQRMAAALRRRGLVEPPTPGATS